MKNVPWPTTAKVLPPQLNIEADSRGGASLGGHAKFERGPGALWRGKLDVVPMRVVDALDFRGFLHSLRGRGGSFLFTIPADVPDRYEVRKTRFTDGTTFSDGTSFTDSWIATVASGRLTAAVDAGAASLTINAALAAQNVVKVGAFLVVGDPESGGQLFRITSVTGSTIGIRPRVREGYEDEADVTVGQVEARFRLDQGTPPVPLDGDMSRSVQIKIVEDY